MDLKGFLENKNDNTNEAALDEYEELLVKRDQLNKEAASYMVVYTQEYGDLVVENFELKVECIKIKKMISYCRRRINRGLVVNSDHMLRDIDKEMTLYYAELKDLVEHTKSAKKAEDVGAFRFTRSKKIYRRLAKVLHPDVNEKTMENEKLRELWDRIVKAYNKSDVNELDDLEVLVRKALEELGDSGFEIDYSDIEERITRVERQINDILTTEPYIYGEMLNDEEKKQAHKNLLKEEHDDYEQYLKNLTSVLEETLKNGGTTLTWKMD